MCEVIIERTPKPFEYLLTFKRIIEEGEELDEESEIQYQFSLYDAIEFSKDRPVIAELAYSWFYPPNNRRYLYEFETEGNTHMADLFEVTVCQCMFESKMQQSHTEASESQILQYLGDRTQLSRSRQSTPNKSSPIVSPKAQTPQPSPAPKAQPVTPAKTPVRNDNSSSILNNNNASTSKPDFPPLSSAVDVDDGEELIQTFAKLYTFVDASGEFVFKEDVKAEIRSYGGYKYNLILLKQNDEAILAQDISNEMYLHFNSEYLSIIWIYNSGGFVWTFSLIFPDKESDEEFKNLIAKCLYERNSSKPFEKIKSDDVDWIVKGFEENVKMEEVTKDVDISDFVDPEEEKKLNLSEQEEEEEEEEDDDDESEGEPQSPTTARNSQLSVGYKNDRSYVVRGSKIGVFKHTPNNKLKFSTTIRSLKTKEGEFFSPRKIMLHEEDKSLLMLHPDKKDKIFRLDLNRHDVVEEWKTHEFHKVKDIVPQTKYAQMTADPMLYGMNDLGMMVIDPRLPKEKVVDSRTFMYKPTSKPHLSCAATTETGHVAIGSQTGEIRMYSSNTFGQPKKNLDSAPIAKTSLPGFGDPVIGIDVTADGQWILATCKTYLLVIPTKMESGKTGFESRMGKEKPAPRRLQLRREHIAKMGNVAFTPARFNTGTDKETSIVTSTGPYVITWNFSKVKQNVLDEYQVKQFSEVIVGDEFRYGTDKAIVVATPNDVSMAKKVVKTFTSHTPVTPMKQ